MSTHSSKLNHSHSHSGCPWSFDWRVILSLAFCYWEPRTMQDNARCHCQRGVSKSRQKARAKRSTKCQRVLAFQGLQRQSKREKERGGDRESSQCPGYWFTCWLCAHLISDCLKSNMRRAMRGWELNWCPVLYLHAVNKEVLYLCNVN